MNKHSRLLLVPFLLITATAVQAIGGETPAQTRFLLPTEICAFRAFSWLGNRAASLATKAAHASAVSADRTRLAASGQALLPLEAFAFDAASRITAKAAEKARAAAAAAERTLDEAEIAAKEKKAQQLHSAVTRDRFLQYKRQEALCREICNKNTRAYACRVCERVQSMRKES